MSDPERARYDELLRGLYLGRLPAWVRDTELPRASMVSENRRTLVAQTLARRFPRASFYATAICGAEYLDGVCARLVDRADIPGEIDDRIAEIALGWARRAGGALASLFEYDALLAAAPATRLFEHDVVPFAAMLDQWRGRGATGDIVRRWSPAARTHTLVARVNDDGGVTVRELAQLAGG